jgi:hypothetical protein
MSLSGEGDTVRTNLSHEPQLALGCLIHADNRDAKGPVFNHVFSDQESVVWHTDCVSRSQVQLPE